MGMNKFITTAACLCFAAPTGALLAAPSAALPLQTGTITGHVQDTKGKPIAQAQVTILGTGETTMTDKDGAYIFTGEDPGFYTIKASATKYRYEALTLTVQPHITQVLNLFLEDASYVPRPLTKGKQPPIAIISVITSQGHRVPPLDPIANGPLNPFQGDLGLHSTARSR